MSPLQAATPVCACFYMVGTFVACLLSVIACFCKQTKTGEAKATGKQFAAAGAVVAVAAVCVGGFSLQSSSLPSADNAEIAPRCGADFCR